MYHLSCPILPCPHTPQDLRTPERVETERKNKTLQVVCYMCQDEAQKQETENSKDDFKLRTETQKP